MNKFAAIVPKTRAKIAAGVALVGGLPATVLAAVPEGVTEALGDAKDDGLTIAGLVLVAIIAMFAFKMMRKGL